MAGQFKKKGGFTLYSLRKIAGIKARSANGFARCIGSKLKGGKFSKPAAGLGGRNDTRIQGAFKDAVRTCRGGAGA